MSTPLEYIKHSLFYAGARPRVYLPSKDIIRGQLGDELQREKKWEQSECWGKWGGGDIKTIQRSGVFPVSGALLEDSWFGLRSSYFWIRQADSPNTRGRRSAPARCSPSVKKKSMTRAEHLCPNPNDPLYKFGLHGFK